MIFHIWNDGDSSVGISGSNAALNVNVDNLDGEDRDELSTVSLFAFCREVLEFDLSEFFRRNSPVIKREVHETLEALLNA